MVTLVEITFFVELFAFLFDFSCIIITGILSASSLKGLSVKDLFDMSCLIVVIVVDKVDNVVEGVVLVIISGFFVVTREVTVLRGGEVAVVVDNVVPVVVLILSTIEGCVLISIVVEDMESCFCVVGSGTSRYSSGI